VVLLPKEQKHQQEHQQDHLQDHQQERLSLVAARVAEAAWRVPWA
jgi:hypothetical protein